MARLQAVREHRELPCSRRCTLCGACGGGSEMSAPVDVVVAIPAHNEQRLVRRCVESVKTAAGHAADAGVAGRVLVAVAAHRCTDRTAEEVLTCLSSYRGPFLVTVDRLSPTVGAVRARLLADVAARYPLHPGAWILNTDADSEVPAAWISELITRSAATDQPAAIAGLVELTGWAPSELARRRYDAIIKAGVHTHTHDHVYGANLAVRWDAYTAVGGFHSVGHGEDHDLVDRLRDQNFAVATTFSPLVKTSGRAPGRAGHGLGALLARLEGAPNGSPRLRATHVSVISERRQDPQAAEYGRWN